MVAMLIPSEIRSPARNRAMQGTTAPMERLRATPTRKSAMRGITAPRIQHHQQAVELAMRGTTAPRDRGLGLGMESAMRGITALRGHTIPMGVGPGEYAAQRRGTTAPRDHRHLPARDARRESTVRRIP